MFANVVLLTYHYCSCFEDEEVEEITWLMVTQSVLTTARVPT